MACAGTQQSHLRGQVQARRLKHVGERGLGPERTIFCHVQVNVWDIREAKSVATMYGPKISGDSVDIRGDQILTGANRGTDQLQLWDWRTQKLVTQFTWDT